VARACWRATVRSLMQDIQQWLRQQNVKQVLSGPEGERRVNTAITRLSSRRLREDLVSWLNERHQITAGRAARAAFDNMQQTLPDSASEDQLRDTAQVNGTDREWLRQLRQVDAGLLSKTATAEEAGATTDSLAEELGNRITRQLRLGLDQEETVQELSRRVELVMDDGSADDRQENGVSGQTSRSKAELIAHDSVQDAYNTAARKRYLRNGFRFAIYDATIDTRTSEVCRRMNEEVIDMVKTPWLIPPLHPYCRSGIRPVLQPPSEALDRDQIADGFLQTIMQTKSYRPQTIGEEKFQTTPLTVRNGQT